MAVLGNLLLYRFVIFNTLMGSFMAWLASKGYVGLLIASDPTGISLGIMVLFGFTFISTLRQLWKVTKEKNRIKDKEFIYNAGPGAWKDKLKGALKRLIKLRGIKLAADTMSMLGIIGTVVGFIVAFSVADPTAIIGTDIGSMAATVLGMVKGMSIALYTTLTGAILGVWTTWNHAMIKDAVDILKVDSDVR